MIYHTRVVQLYLLVIVADMLWGKSYYNLIQLHCKSNASQKEELRMIAHGGLRLILVGGLRLILVVCALISVALACFMFVKVCRMLQ